MKTIEELIQMTKMLLAEKNPLENQFFSYIFRGYLEDVLAVLEEKETELPKKAIPEKPAVKAKKEPEKNDPAIEAIPEPEAEEGQIPLFFTNVGYDKSKYICVKDIAEKLGFAPGTVQNKLRAAQIEPTALYGNSRSFAANLYPHDVVQKIGTRIRKNTEKAAAQPKSGKTITQRAICSLCGLTIQEVSKLLKRCAVKPVGRLNANGHPLNLYECEACAEAFIPFIERNRGKTLTVDDFIKAGETPFKVENPQPAAPAKEAATLPKPPIKAQPEPVPAKTAPEKHVTTLQTVYSRWDAEYRDTLKGQESIADRFHDDFMKLPVKTREMPIEKVTYSRIDSAIADGGKRLRESSGRIHKLIIHLLNYSEEKGILPVGPVLAYASCFNPKQETRKKDFGLKEAELTRLRRNFDLYPDRKVISAVLLMVEIGITPGELLALQADDICITEGEEEILFGESVVEKDGKAKLFADPEFVKTRTLSGDALVYARQLKLSSSGKYVFENANHNVVGISDFEKSWDAMTLITDLPKQPIVPAIRESILDNFRGKGMTDDEIAKELGIRISI